MNNLSLIYRVRGQGLIAIEVGSIGEAVEKFCCHRSDCFEGFRASQCSSAIVRDLDQDKKIVAKINYNGSLR